MFLLKKQILNGLSVLVVAAGIALAFGIDFTGTAMAISNTTALRLNQVGFNNLPGWRADNHRAAFLTFLRSCNKLGKQRDGLSRACRKARSLPHNLSSAQAKAFFEAYFAPHKVLSGGSRGLLTGYYEPVIRGSRTHTGAYTIPLYRRPSDLVALHGKEMRRKARRFGLPAKLTYARLGGGKLSPYMTREQIESGGLRGRGLEILWLSDPVDAFFLHIQGSGIIVLQDGTRVRVGFDGKNGYGYTSVGRSLVRSHTISRKQATLDGVKGWLRANPVEGRRAMWLNKSFIFFRELPNDRQMDGPIGAQGVPLVGGCSLAVDRRHYRLGLPIYLNVKGYSRNGKGSFQRLMIAQDTGTAIRGAKRGDIFWGSGFDAGEKAGGTYHRGEFYVLLPRNTPRAATPAFKLPGSNSFSVFKTLTY